MKVKLLRRFTKRFKIIESDRYTGYTLIDMKKSEVQNFVDIRSCVYTGCWELLPIIYFNWIIYKHDKRKDKQLIRHLINKKA